MIPEIFLRTCPCCGADAVIEESYDRTKITVKCKNKDCGVQTPPIPIDLYIAAAQEAADRWNRRV